MLAMIAGLVLAGAAAAIPYDEPLNGECRYSPEVVERAEGVTLLLCNIVTLDEGGVEFGQRSWERHFRFNGWRDGDVYTITSLTLQNGNVEAAEGSCRLYYTSERLSTVTCMAVTDRHISYAGNIAISRI